MNEVTKVHYCEILTIAAMQGHAIEEMMAFRFYVGLIMLAEKSLYAANFMKYGFILGSI